MNNLLLLVSILFCAQAFGQVLATVGNNKITVEDFNRRYDEVRKQSTNPPTMDQFLEDLVRYEVGAQQAEKEKLQNDALMKERFKQAMYNGLLEKELGKKIDEVKITEAEMREFYKKNPEVRISHILLEVKAGAKPVEHDAVKKRAQEILDEARNSKRPFEEVARLYTDDLPSKENGGDIGYQSRVTLSPQLYDVAMNMKVGDVKGLIETPYGFHIIKLTDRRAFDMADKRQVRAALFDDKRGKIFNDFFEKLKKQYKIEINKEALKALKR